MYLANDVIQNSRKKGPEYGREYGVVLKKSFAHLASVGYDDHMRTSLGRLLKIWKERDIYDELQITEFRQALCKFHIYIKKIFYLIFKFIISVLPAEKPTNKTKRPNNDAVTSEKKRKLSPSNEKSEKKKSDTEITVEIDGIVETHVHLSPRTPANDPPEPEELIKALQELESNSASADEAVRERVSQLPREVSDVAELVNIQGKI